MKTNEKKSKSAISHHCSEEVWQLGESLYTNILRRSYRRTGSMQDIFDPLSVWIKTLTAEAKNMKNRRYLDGAFIDCNWHNSFYIEESCQFIDKEWVYNKDIPLNTVVLRCIFNYLMDITHYTGIRPYLRHMPGIFIILSICDCVRVKVVFRDLIDYFVIEMNLMESVYGKRRIHTIVELLPFLFLSASLRSHMHLLRKIVSWPIRRVKKIFNIYPA